MVEIKVLGGIKIKRALFEIWIKVCSGVEINFWEGFKVLVKTVIVDLVDTAETTFNIPN